MKRFLIFLLLFSISFSSFGESFILLERTWLIEGQGNYSFDGAIAINSTNQELIALNTSPQMVLVQDPDGNLRLRYNGSAPIIKASALFRVDYDTNLSEDPPLPSGEENATDLTKWDEMIQDSAKNISANSSLETIRGLSSFVNAHINYNGSMFGEIPPATDVYSIRQGVCTEYSHLLISMSNSIGFRTRYVTGYANGGAWQPHAWVEFYLPGYGWLPADPTFNQLGILDNSHIALAIGRDQSEVFDSLLSENNMSMSVSERVSFINITRDTKGLLISHAFDNSSGKLSIFITNTRPQFAYTTYSIILPPKFQINESRIILLHPNEKKKMEYQINISSLEQGYRHTIPIKAYAGDSGDVANLVVIRSKPPEASQEAPLCPLSLILLLLINLYFSNQ